MKTDGLFMNTKYYECLGTDALMVWVEVGRILPRYRRARDKTGLLPVRNDQVISLKRSQQKDLRLGSWLRRCYNSNPRHGVAPQTRGFISGSSISDAYYHLFGLCCLVRCAI
jgi:hypothetical protein